VCAVLLFSLLLLFWPLIRVIIYIETSPQADEAREVIALLVLLNANKKRHYKERAFFSASKDVEFQV
jgi:hypothetical protein